MKAIQVFLLTTVIFLFPFVVEAQTNTTETASVDTTVVQKETYYKTAEISFEIENTMRYVKEKDKQIESYQNLAEIDSSFTRLRAHIHKEFEDFASFNKQNLSKFFLLNTKKVWSSYMSQLMGWQSGVSGRIAELMEISKKIKEKEKLWVTTSNRPDIQLLPDVIKSRILNSIDDLHKLERNLFNVIGQLSVLESKIADQVIDVEQHIAEIEELHKNYRVNILKKTQPIIWKTEFKGSYEGSVKERLKKVWYENTKSIKDSIPALKEYLDDFILWSLLFVVIIFGFRYWYLKRNHSKELSDDDITELIINHPQLSLIYLILFIFVVLFSNIPLAIGGIISLIILVVTYFLIQHYIQDQGKRIIITFIILMIVNTFEIVLWYFGNYARLYLLMESILGIILVSHFITPTFSREYLSKFRYKFVIDLLRYPVFILYVFAFVVNIFGFQNLTVLLMKMGTQVPVSIIVIIGAWEISKSSLFILFKIINSLKQSKSNKYMALLRSRLTLLLALFFALVWFDSFLTIVEVETPFNEMLHNTMNMDRSIGSFTFTYNAIYQFILIMLIAWGLATMVKIIFDEGNFKKTQRMRGVPAAISTTLRLIIGLSGFFLALSGAGIDLTKISILIGAFGVGIGFGLQNIVNNFISGLILIYERPIQVGDTIEINTLMGQVKSIGIRSSKVRTFEGAEVVVPNGLLVSDQLINWTLSDDNRRIEIVVGVKYGTDPELVIRILKKVAMGHELVSKEPEPRVLFNEFGDSSLNFRLLVWVLFENGIQTKSDIAVAIDHAFKENNIEIPFPQLDLHVIDTPVEKTIGSDNLKSEPISKPLITDESGIGKNENETDNNS